MNLTCFSFIQHDTEKLLKLTSIADDVSEAIGRKVEYVSGGNSAALDLMLRGGIPAGVNNLRLGESLLFGKERARYQYLPGTHKDVFMLQCEIVELKEKPSLPWGTVGVDSYGRRPEFTDRGPKRLKAVCALGKQDFDPETTVPADPKMILLGASSDHLMLDLTDADGEFHVHVEMIVPVAWDWDSDGLCDLFIGDEDSSISLLRNTGKTDGGMPL